MKIVAINGSHRGNEGYTRYLLDLLIAGAEKEGADCEIITLSKMKINICEACGICQTEQHFLRCIYYDMDDVTMIFNKMREADIIAYATPIHIFTMSGLMKVFLDRIYGTGDSHDLCLTESGLFFHHISKDIYSKPFVVLVSQDNLENEISRNVVSYFHTFSKFMDAPLVGTIVRRSGRLTGYGKNPELEKLYPKIIESYKAIAQAGRELVMHGKITRKTQKIASQDIIPVPCIGLLKQMKWFKKKAIDKMRITEKL